MNMLKQLNDALLYIEQNLCDEIDCGKAARIACVTEDSFLRFFSYMTGMTLHEYIRRRRLSLAGSELQQSDERILDIAVKYGYDSADAFSRAFARQHGITPTALRKSGGALKIYPPVSFHISIKGAKKMDFRLIELEETSIYGMSRQFDGQGYGTREELRHLMWSDACDHVPGKICEGEWNQPGNHAYDGAWYGLWRDGRYMIARKREDVQETDAEELGLEKQVLSGGKYAAFRTEPGTLAWEELPKLFELIFEAWLPDSGFQRSGEDIIEVYHLWTDKEERKQNRYYEVWVPVK